MSKQANKGIQVYMGTPESLSDIVDQCRSFLHMAFGPEEGERKLYALSAREAFTLWFNKTRNVRESGKTQ